MMWSNGPGRWGSADPEVDDFVERNIVSFAAWDLVLFLSHDPDPPVPLAEIADLLGRHEGETDTAMTRLVDSGVARRSERDGVVAYGLADDPRLRGTIGRFIALVARQDYRLECVRRVLARISGG